MVRLWPRSPPPHKSREGELRESNSRPRVIEIPPSEADRVTEVLCDAFHDYPVMRYVIDDHGPGYPDRLRTLISFFVMARALRGEPLLGVWAGGELGAVATVSFPAAGDAPQELAQIRDGVWNELGTGARGRYEACGLVWGPLDQVDGEHIHLNMIGVRAQARGLGLARLLLDRVHRISVETEGSKGVTLTTEDSVNVPFYERMGYEVVGRAEIYPGLESWGMFRRD